MAAQEMSPALATWARGIEHGLLGGSTAWPSPAEGGSGQVGAGRATGGFGAGPRGGFGAGVGGGNVGAAAAGPSPGGLVVGAGASVGEGAGPSPGGLVVGAGPSWGLVVGAGASVGEGAGAAGDSVWTAGARASADSGAGACVRVVGVGASRFVLSAFPFFVVAFPFPAGFVGAAASAASKF